MHIDIRYDYKPKSKIERNKAADKHKVKWNGRNTNERQKIIIKSK